MSIHLRPRKTKRIITKIVFDIEGKLPLETEGIDINLTIGLSPLLNNLVDRPIEVGRRFACFAG